MVEIGVVGAGPSAAAATYVIDGAHPNASVTVLEKSGGLCGRAATRRHGERTYDYGANYLKDEDERVEELVTEELDPSGLVEIPEPIYTFDETGAVTEGRPPSGAKWSYERGLTQIAKRLFTRTDASVRRNTPVRKLHWSDTQWWAIDDQGSECGPFDCVVLNPPAPQTATLLERTEWTADARDSLIHAAGEVEFRTVYTAVLGYEFELARPYYGLVNPSQDHAVGWISREECKRGHVPAGETLLIVQASGWWSEEHYDAPPADVISALAEEAASIMGDDRLVDPAWTDHQRWRYALPETRIAPGPVRQAETAGLYCTGDWVTGEARLHAALRNGLDVGERIVHAV
ncbi:MAG: NAD(P)/FAD-dependent oxidoreductase [Halodesulfurarchaeum sp.]